MLSHFKRTSLAELLLASAGTDHEKRAVVGLVILSPNWSWDDFLTMDHPQKEWALAVVARAAKDDETAPAELREMGEAMSRVSGIEPADVELVLPATTV